jgi:hypothetical protein
MAAEAHLRIRSDPFPALFRLYPSPTSLPRPGPSSVDHVTIRQNTRL